MRHALLAGVAAGCLLSLNPPAEVGGKAPDFTLPGADGTSTSLSGFRGKNVVLVFYRGYW